MMRRILTAVTVLVALLSAAAFGRETPDQIASVDVDGTVFRVRLTNGNVIAGADLVGATLTLAGIGHTAPRRIFIQSVKLDPMDSDHEILLYHLLAVDPTTHHQAELCGLNADGERWGFPLRGEWDVEGRHISDAGYTLTCADGAQGKCVRLGYKPWKTLANGTRLDAYHQACIRLVRADYCGGRGTTRNGMPIEIYDTAGVRALDPEADVAAGLRFEAAWSPAGAVCVAHTRVPENMTLEQLAKECPRLVGHLGETACTPRVSDSSQRALLYNHSH